MAKELISLIIEPKAKGRPRFTRQGHTYTPQETRDYEEQLAKMIKAVWGGPPLDGPLAMSVIFFLKEPKKPKWPMPAVRPDLDNYVKALLDAANGILFHDDAQIVDLAIYKRYDQRPRIMFEISVPIESQHSQEQPAEPLKVH